MLMLKSNKLYRLSVWDSLKFRLNLLLERWQNLFYSALKYLGIFIYIIVTIKLKLKQTASCVN
jgi:hypothetical protein